MPKFLATIFLFAFCAIITFGSANAEDNWPRFRGANGEGQATGFSLPKDWDKSQVAWKVELKHKGQSSPIIWGEHLYITYADPTTAEQTLLCLNATTGDELWQKQFNSKAYHTHRMNDFASTTPAVDAEHVYLSWANEEAIHLAAVSHDGATVVWDKNLGKHKSNHGFCSSPIIYKDMVILTNDQIGKSSIIALDCKTGDKKWIAERTSGTAAYATPAIFTGKDGKDQLICCSTASGMVALDPNNKGKQLWQLSNLMTARCVSSPFISEGLIFATHGSGSNARSLVVVKPPVSSGEKPELVEEVKKNMPYVPTCVENDGLLFFWHDTGKILCMDPKTRKKIWTKRVGGKFHGSPICVDDKLYCIAFDGTLNVVPATKKYVGVTKYKLGENSRATPTVVNGKMYLRTDTTLLCVENAKAGLAKSE